MDPESTWWAVRVGTEIKAMFRYPHWADEYAKLCWDGVPVVVEKVEAAVKPGCGHVDAITHEAPHYMGPTTIPGGCITVLVVSVALGMAISVLLWLLR